MIFFLCARYHTNAPIARANRESKMIVFIGILFLFVGYVVIGQGKDKKESFYT
jgi:hypothetical protein